MIRINSRICFLLSLLFFAYASSTSEIYAEGDKVIQNAEYDSRFALVEKYFSETEQTNKVLFDQQKYTSVTSVYDLRNLYNQDPFISTDYTATLNEVVGQYYSQLASTDNFKNVQIRVILDMYVTEDTVTRSDQINYTKEYCKTYVKRLLNASTVGKEFILLYFGTAITKSNKQYSIVFPVISTELQNKLSVGSKTAFSQLGNTLTEKINNHNQQKEMLLADASASSDYTPTSLRFNSLDVTDAVTGAGSVFGIDNHAFKFKYTYSLTYRGVLVKTQIYSSTNEHVFIIDAQRQYCITATIPNKSNDNYYQFFTYSTTSYAIKDQFDNLAILVSGRFLEENIKAEFKYPVAPSVDAADLDMSYPSIIYDFRDILRKPFLERNYVLPTINFPLTVSGTYNGGNCILIPQEIKNVKSCFALIKGNASACNSCEINILSGSSTPINNSDFDKLAAWIGSNNTKNNAAFVKGNYPDLKETGLDASLITFTYSNSTESVFLQKFSASNCNINIVGYTVDFAFDICNANWYLTFKNADNGEEAIKFKAISYSAIALLLNKLKLTIPTNVQSALNAQYTALLSAAGTDCDKLDFIYFTAPPNFIKNISDDDKFKHLKALSLCPVDGGCVDEEEAILNILKSIKDKNAFYLKLYPDLEIIKDLYSGFDNGNNDEFVSLITDISQSSWNSKGDYVFEYGNDVGCYFCTAPNYTQHGRFSPNGMVDLWGISSYNGTILEYPELRNFHPLSTVFVVYTNPNQNRDKIVVPVPALFLKDLADNQNIADIKRSVIIVSNFLGGYGALKTLAAGTAGRLITFAAYSELTLLSFQTCIENESVNQYILQKPWGESFLESYRLITLGMNLANFGISLRQNFIDNASDVSAKLRSQGKNAEADEILRIKGKLANETVSNVNGQWLLWSQYSKKVINGEEFAIVGSRYYSKPAVESMVPTGLGGSGVPPSIIDDVITNGDDVIINTQKRFDKGNIFVWTENNGSIVRSIRVNKVNSISDLVSNPQNIFGYLDNELDALLVQNGWFKGSYNGTSDAVMYFKQTNAGRSEIVFNYGGGLHSGGQTFKKPYYYKLEGPEFGRKIRIIDKQTYPVTEFQNAIQNETFRLVDGPTGTIWKQ